MIRTKTKNKFSIFFVDAWNCPTILCSILLVAGLLLAFFINYASIIPTSNSHIEHHDLPDPIHKLIGREKELKDLKSLLQFTDPDTPQIVSITGGPGFGKSTLAIYIGHALMDEGITVIYVDLSEEFTGKDKIAGKIMGKNVTMQELFKWSKHLKSHTLLILDSCDEQFHSRASKDDLQNTVTKLVKSKYIKILTTSRRQVSYLEKSKLYPVTELSVSHACELLREAIQFISDDQCADIAHLTGSVPLALRVVGALLNMPNAPSPEEIISQLKDSLIKTLSPEELQTADTVNASILLSYKYLESPVQEAGRYLSYFPGQFSKEEACAIIESQLPNYDSPFDVPSQLVKRSLLNQVFHGRAKETYAYHMLIREFFKGMSDAIEKEKFNMEFLKYYITELQKLAQAKSHNYLVITANTHHSGILLYKPIIVTEAIMTVRKLNDHINALKEQKLEEKIHYKRVLDLFLQISQVIANTMAMIKELNELSTVHVEANMQTAHDIVKDLAGVTNIIDLDPMDMVNNLAIIAEASMILQTMNFTSESTKLEDGLVAGFHELSTYDLLDLMEKQSDHDVQIFIGTNVYKVTKHRNDPPVLLQRILLIIGNALFASGNYEESAVYYSKLEVSSRLLPIRACFRLMIMRSFKCLPFVLHLTAATAQKNFNDLLTFTWQIFETAPKQKEDVINDYVSKEVATTTTDLVTPGVIPKQEKIAEDHIYFDGKLLVSHLLSFLLGVLLSIPLSNLHILKSCMDYQTTVRPFSNHVCRFFIFVLQIFMLFLYICVIFSVY